MSDDPSRPARQPIYDLDDDEGYDASWAPIVNLIENSEWVRGEELARRLSNGWLIPKVVRELIADRIEGKDLRRRGRPKSAMSDRLAYALISVRPMRRAIRALGGAGRGKPNSKKERAKEHGTPTERAFLAAARTHRISPDSLRHWFASPPRNRRPLSSADLDCERPFPLVDWDATVRVLGGRRKRLRPADRRILAEAIRRDPEPPTDILQILQHLLDRTN